MNFVARRGLWIWLTVYTLVALATVATVGLGRAPDEWAHWEYVESIVARGKLPVFAGQSPPSPGYEFHQPPLYYLLCAPLWKILPAGLQNYGCRLVCTLLGLWTVALIWKTARRLWPDDTRLAHLATGLAALWPLHVGVSAASNNDALGGLICAYLFGRIALLAQDTPQKNDAIAIGIAVGLGLLSKNTTLVVGFVAIASLWWFARRASSASANNANAMTPLRALSISCGLALLIAAPLLIRNTIIYDGDPLGWKMFSQAASNVAPGLLDLLNVGISAAVYFRGLLLTTFCTMWGFFGGPDSVVATLKPLRTSGPQWPDFPLSMLMLACAVASLISVIGLLKYFAAWRIRLREGQSTRRDELAACWLIGVVLIGAAWLNFAVAHFAGAQARYLHPALLPMCIGAAWGWSKIWGRGRALTLASIAFALVLIVLNGWNIVVWKTLV